MKQYCKKSTILDRFQITREELETLTGEILSMMKGKSSQCTFEITVGGERVPFLNGKELRHLQEIAELIGRCNVVMVVFLILLVVAVFFLWKRKKLIELARGVYAGLAILLCTGGLCVCLSYQNLSGWIDGFHRIFFKGYQWVLNPAKDRLIYLCPNSLFREAITTLIIGMSIYFLLSLVMAVVISWKNHKTKASKSVG